MSTEAQVAMLMLRLLVDTPKELQAVMDYIHREVLLQKAILEVGNKKLATRKEIIDEFEEKFGLTVNIAEDEPTFVPKETVADENMTGQMFELPSGAKFKVG